MLPCDMLQGQALRWTEVCNSSRPALRCCPSGAPMADMLVFTPSSTALCCCPFLDRQCLTCCMSFPGQVCEVAETSFLSPQSRRPKARSCIISGPAYSLASKGSMTRVPCIHVCRNAFSMHVGCGSPAWVVLAIQVMFQGRRPLQAKTEVSSAFDFAQLCSTSPIVPPG